MPNRNEPKILYQCPGCGEINDYSKMVKVVTTPICWLLFRDNIQKCYFAAQSNSHGYDQLKAKYGRAGDRTYTRDHELPDKWRGLPLKRF